MRNRLLLPIWNRGSNTKKACTQQMAKIFWFLFLFFFFSFNFMPQIKPNGLMTSKSIFCTWIGLNELVWNGYGGTFAIIYETLQSNRIINIFCHLHRIERQSDNENRQTNLWPEDLKQPIERRIRERSKAWEKK